MTSRDLKNIDKLCDVSSVISLLSTIDVLMTSICICIIAVTMNTHVLSASKHKALIYPNVYRAIVTLSMGLKKMKTVELSIALNVATD